MAETMKAVMFVPGLGGATQAILVRPVPVPGPGEALVRVHAAGVNRGEFYIRRGLTSGDPQPAGIESAGEVVALGEGTTQVKVGDRVMCHQRGGQAEYVAADQRLLVPIPKRLSWVEAAAWLNVNVTAHDAIVSNARLQSGKSLLVNAASSSIGVASLQIARLLGAKPVIATSRSRAKLDALRAHGMTVGIDVTAGPLAPAVMEATGGRGVDVIVDNVGGNMLGQHLDALAVLGRLVSVGRLGAETGELNMELLAHKRAKLIGATFRTRSQEERIACVRRCAEDLWGALDDGRLQPLVHRTFRMAEAKLAHDCMAQDQHIGKLVLEIR
ncbi:MAG: zinc-binding dehydrogenase [Lautropia sp.]